MPTIDPYEDADDRRDRALEVEDDPAEYMNPPLVGPGGLGRIDDVWPRYGAQTGKEGWAE